MESIADANHLRAPNTPRNATRKSPVKIKQKNLHFN